MDKVMLPPWLKYPEFECGSLGWRMGGGEDYLTQLFKWQDTLSDAEKKEYDNLFQEPIHWNGDDYPVYGFIPADRFFIMHWRKNGRPKYLVESIKQSYQEGNKQKFVFFWGHTPSSDGRLTNTCLSQWWKADFCHTAELFCCMEQFMMSVKASLFDDCIGNQIMKTDDPKKIKQLGRQVRGFDKKIWDEWKHTIVLSGNYEKFMQNVELRDFLIATGDAILVEASPYDQIWGIGMSKDDPDATNPMKWKGQNLLGFALMEVRDEIQRVCKNYYKYK